MAWLLAVALAAQGGMMVPTLIMSAFMKTLAHHPARLGAGRLPRCDCARAGGQCHLGRNRRIARLRVRVFQIFPVEIPLRVGSRNYRDFRRCFSSISPSCAKHRLSSSFGSYCVPNQLSRISLVTTSAVSRMERQSTFALFHSRAPRAVSGSAHKAARMPGSLLAAKQTPVPVQQSKMPSSASPATTRSATCCATADLYS